MRTDFYSIINKILCVMQRRFTDNTEIITYTSTCDPKSDNFMIAKVLYKVAKWYIRNDETFITIEARCDLLRQFVWFARILLKRLLVLIIVKRIAHISSNSNRHSISRTKFSAMRKIKPYLGAKVFPLFSDFFFLIVHILGLILNIKSYNKPIKHVHVA